MKTFTFVLVLSAFIQTSVVPLNLVLLLLIARALTTNDRANLWFAFLAGVLVSFLSSVNLGFYSLIYLVVIKLCQAIQKSTISSNLLTILPVALLFALFSSFLEQLFLGISINKIMLVWEGVLSLPIYLFVKFWEERFIVSAPLRLKL